MHSTDTQRLIQSGAAASSGNALGDGERILLLGEGDFGFAAALALGASARDAMAGRARTHVERSFSLDTMGSATLDVYAALLDRGTADGGGG